MQTTIATRKLHMLVVVMIRRNNVLFLSSFLLFFLLLTKSTTAVTETTTTGMLKGSQHVRQLQTNSTVTTTSNSSNANILSIRGVELVQTNSDKIIGDLVNNTIIDLALYKYLYEPTKLNFHFVTTNVTTVNNTTMIQSVRVKYRSLAINNTLNSNTFERYENLAPYTLCGDDVGNYLDCKSLQYGLNRIDATAYSLPDLQGSPGITQTWYFTIINTRNGTTTNTTTATTTVAPAIAPITITTTTNKPVVAPVRVPTKSPLSITKAPTKKPVTAPTKQPVAAPTKQPVTPPTKQPVTPPTKQPVAAPTKQPVAAPTTKPIITPTTATKSPTNALQCTIPKLLGEWEEYEEYPLPIGEGQGMILPNGIFVLYSGFTEAFGKVTRQVYGYNTTMTTTLDGDNDIEDEDDEPEWIRLDDIIVPVGISHSAYAHRPKENVFYACGGYVGKHPGPATNECVQFNYTKPRGQQWSYLPNLPMNRSGGGMILDSMSNTLLYATGASRTDPLRKAYTIDHDDVWELNLNNVRMGWQTKPKIPYQANHMGFVTVTYQGTTERHYYLGGQHGEKEADTNMNQMYEWKRSTNQWIPRKSLPIGRGHFSSSVIPYKGCGFLVLGGRYNSGSTADVSYYDIGSDMWTNIGILPRPIKTPVCDITNTNDKLYCQTGDVNGEFSYRIRIV